MALGRQVDRAGRSAERDVVQGEHGSVPSPPSAAAVAAPACAPGVCNRDHGKAQVPAPDGRELPLILEVLQLVSSSFGRLFGRVQSRLPCR